MYDCNSRDCFKVVTHACVVLRLQHSVANENSEGLAAPEAYSVSTPMRMRRERRRVLRTGSRATRVQRAHAEGVCHVSTLSPLGTGGVREYWGPARYLGTRGVHSASGQRGGDVNATALDGRTLLHHYTIAGKVSGSAAKPSGITGVPIPFPMLGSVLWLVSDGCAQAWCD